MAKADRVVRKLREVHEWAQSAMAIAQQRQENAANRSRTEAPVFKVNDKVWLDLEHIKTDRPCKKLDAKYAKYTITEVISSHAYRLDTPPGIHDVQPVRRLKPVRNNPLPGQIVTDKQPSAIVQDLDAPEYEVEKILDQKRARGRGQNWQYLVKWKGYRKPTWEPKSALEETIALDEWEASKGEQT